MTLDQAATLNQLAGYAIDVDLVGVDVRGWPVVQVHDANGWHDPWAVNPLGAGRAVIGNPMPLDEWLDTCPHAQPGYVLDALALYPVRNRPRRPL